ncbi:DUF4166 domain-containing protein [Lysobacter sp. HA18]
MTERSAGSSVVETWLGHGAERLHPALRALHSVGGRLAGDVDTYVADHVIGRRLARRMGLTTGTSRVRMQVDVVPGDDGFVWTRRFDGGPAFASHFRPVGCWPTGVWRERTGRTQIELSVDLADGHWRWQHRSTSIAGLRIPARLAPRVRGEKRIVDGMYRFDVELALPLLGTVMRYGGLMTMVGPITQAASGD